jgi:hypothetical protein
MLEGLSTSPDLEYDQRHGSVVQRSADQSRSAKPRRNPN